MKVHEIMTAHARCVGPDNTLVEAAGLMRELDVGALPVCKDDRLAGMVTDRDLVLRGTANGKDPNTTAVREVMTAGITAVNADQDVEEAVRLMEEKQIRRLPVLGSDRRLVGIVSLGDIAMSSNPAFSGMALRDVSEPRDPSSRQRRLAQQSQPSEMPAQTGAPGRGEVPGKKSRSGKRTGGRATGRKKKVPGRSRTAPKASRSRKASGSNRSRSRKTAARSSR